MRIILIKLTGLIAGFFMLLSCSPSIKVITENRAPDRFSACDTYSFDPHFDDASPNFSFAPFEKEQIRQMITEELASKNYEESFDNELTIKVLGKIANVQELENSNNPYYYNSWDLYNRGRYYNNRRTKMQKKITLIIDIYENETDKLVWHGEAFDDLDKKDIIDKKLQEIIKLILKDIPSRG